MDDDHQLYHDLHSTVYSQIKYDRLRGFVMEEFDRLHRGLGLDKGEALQRALLAVKLVEPPSNARIAAATEEYEQALLAQDIMNGV